MSYLSQPSCLNKRKRGEKKVRFDVEQPVIINTYSSLEYDRGSIYSAPIQYRINPNIIPKGPVLSLEIPTSPCDSEASSPETEQEQYSPTSPKDKKKKKPRLTVDTSVCSDDGPLFFTKLSTNHVRHNDDNEKGEEDDTMNDYLIPITAQLY
ncbi:hypothetical protein INT47_006970 [Mucor saturninus]|uniref:Uncharacterized protein n=1 Tax=Mucor saturninus TaxID=64648 RepID=A0A8H7QKX0_9FUNG|nr:hypothetical protein INT47_006970 [Mucor saturninus]